MRGTSKRAVPAGILIAALAVHAGCGRTEPYSEEPDPRPSTHADGGVDGGWTQDAGADAGQPTDAGTDAGTDARFPGQWKTPILIPGLNSAWEDAHPTMTADLLRICFSSNRPGGKGLADIWCAERSNASGTFSTPVNQSALNTWGEDWMPALTRTGHELYFSSTGLGGQGGHDIFVATWDPAIQRYGSPVPVAGVNSAWHDSGPALSPDGQTLFFNSTRPAITTGENILQAQRIGSGAAFGNIGSISAANGNAFDQEPGPSADLQHLLFCSNRAGLGVSPPEQFGFLITHRTPSGWTTPTKVVMLGAAGGGGCGIEVLSDNSLIFHSARAGGLGAADLYIAPPIF